MLAFGYNTNGFAHHDLADAIDIIADLGYAGVALTLDTHHLHPLRSGAAEVARVATHLARRGLRATVETGARYVLDPRRKHEPTLVSADPEGRARRLAFLLRCREIAADLGAEAIAVFSGRADPALPEGEAWAHLAEGVTALLDACGSRGGPPLGFEPEPGMLVAALADWDRLAAAVGERLRLTLDVGHLRCTEPDPLPEAIARAAPRAVNVHIEDIRGNVHEHLAFGEGEIDFPPALRALGDAGYAGLVNVELSRHSHDAPSAARRSIEFLREAAEVAWNSS